MDKKQILIKILIFNSIYLKTSFQLSCIDENGKTVDWFIVYKIPRLEDSSIEMLTTGFGYAFITDQSIKSAKDWTLSRLGVDEPKSMFGRTISPVIAEQDSKDMSFVNYNDQTEKSTSGSAAHAKGLFAANSDGGFWFSHSAPKFPTLKNDYSYPDTAARNGQTAVCISLNPKDSKSYTKIAKNLLLMRPNVNEIKLSKSLLKNSPEFQDIEDRRWDKEGEIAQNVIKSLKGLSFSTFSKSPKYKEDLFSAVIADNFKESLMAQTWRNGAGGKLESDCNDKYTVMNVDMIMIPSLKRTDWKYTEDHSKWAISSDDSGRSYTCIADMNRMQSQFKRGGGSICLANKPVWKVFNSSIEDIEGCPIGKRAANFKLDPRVKSVPRSGNYSIITSNSGTSNSIDSKLVSTPSPEELNKLNSRLARKATKDDIVRPSKHLRKALKQLKLTTTPPSTPQARKAFGGSLKKQAKKALKSKVNETD